jgi:heat shock protein HtpX
LALGKLERYQGRLWEDIFMPGRRIPLPSVLRTHPQTSERIARLMALRKPERAPFPVQGDWSRTGGFASLPQSPRYHWTGLWF